MRQTDFSKPRPRQSSHTHMEAYGIPTTHRPDPWTACSQYERREIELSGLHSDLVRRHAELQVEHARVLAENEKLRAVPLEKREEAIQKVVAAAAEEIARICSVSPSDADAEKSRFDLVAAEKRNERLRTALRERTDHNTELLAKLSDAEARRKNDLRTAARLEAELRSVRSDLDLEKARTQCIVELRAELEKQDALLAQKEESRRVFTAIDAEFLQHAEQIRNLVLAPTGALTVCLDKLGELHDLFEEGSRGMLNVNNAEAAVCRARADVQEQTSSATKLAKLFEELVPLAVLAFAKKQPLDVAVGSLEDAIRSGGSVKAAAVGACSKFREAQSKYESLMF